MFRGQELLGLLSDGRFHSGESLAEKLDCSRSAIWKQVDSLRKTTGLDIQAVAGRGYRLDRPLELLERARILEHLPPRLRDGLGGLRIEAVVDSTNEEALRGAAQGLERPMVWLAEQQRRGRGRRGRRWYSPYGRNLYLSLAYPFDIPMARLAGLSLAMGVAVCEALEGEGLRGHGVKWPNDIYWNNAKLGGLLIEIQGEASGPVNVVMGLGVNLDLGGKIPDWIEQSVADLSMAGLDCSRNRLTGKLLESLLLSCESFAADGLAPFLPRFESMDICCGREVVVESAGDCIEGVAAGVDRDGALRLDCQGTVRVIHGGEVSLRMGRAGG
ncbi:MAG: biotin--[acetyl-CoA-carboxylase] ligase [Gammaproteobacteria bacterium]|nr:MAG: biotin--[acetyl-CoA-carboxylase] ligase [Gammaproteobacteria bacterium]